MNTDVRVMRGIGGIVTGGLVALMLVVTGAAVLAQLRDYPGPGISTVSWHVAAGVGAVGVQRFADRREGAVVALAVAGIVLIAGVLLWGQWYR